MIFEAIHNYYEKLVQEQLKMTVDKLQLKLTEEELGDIACVTLNKLPPRYIKYDVDNLFFLSAEEQTEMRKKVNQAIGEAIELVRAHPKE